MNFSFTKSLKFSFANSEHIIRTACLKLKLPLPLKILCYSFVRWNSFDFRVHRLPSSSSRNSRLRKPTDLIVELLIENILRRSSHSLAEEHWAYFQRVRSRNFSRPACEIPVENIRATSHRRRREPPRFTYARSDDRERRAGTGCARTYRHPRTNARTGSAG